MKQALLFTIFALASLLATAQETTWYNPQTAENEVISGRHWGAELRGSYARLPERTKDSLRSQLWNLSKNSAGLNVSFTTDAKHIRVRYGVGEGHNMYHMPSTGVSGIDLYMNDLRTGWCRPEWPSWGDTIYYNYQRLTSNGTADYTLFLPLYNSVKFLEIGVPAGASFAWKPVSPDEPIVVYGTSIAQGACASRPGMAWASIVSRELDVPVVNLGFSGQGQLDMPMFRMLGEVPARAYIIDCMPNMVDELVPEIYGRLVSGVRYLRERSDAPIILTEHDGYMNDLSHPADGASWQASNTELRRAFNALRKEGVKGLYYLSYNDLKLSRDSQVDGVHASDLGMRQYADGYKKLLTRALK